MFTNDDIKKFTGMSDDEFKNQLSEALSAAGINKNTDNLSAEEIRKIKATVSNLNEKDINRILSNVPQDKIDSIKKALNKNN